MRRGFFSSLILLDLGSDKKNIKKWAKLEKDTTYASFELGASREQMSE